MSNTNRYTNASVNSNAKVIYAILSQPHWWLQLQIAENIISDRNEAIAKNQIILQKSIELLQLRGKEQRLSAEERINLKADKALLELDTKKHKMLLRDARMERDCAINLRDKIVKAHPEIKQDYMENQQEFSQQALAATIAKNISTDRIAREFNLPVGTVNSLLSLTPELATLVVKAHNSNLETFFANRKMLDRTTFPA